MIAAKGRPPRLLASRSSSGISEMTNLLSGNISDIFLFPDGSRTFLFTKPRQLPSVPIGPKKRCLLQRPTKSRFRMMCIDTFTKHKATVWPRHPLLVSLSGTVSALPTSNLDLNATDAGS